MPETFIPFHWGQFLCLAVKFISKKEIPSCLVKLSVWLQSGALVFAIYRLIFEKVFAAACSSPLQEDHTAL